MSIRKITLVKFWMSRIKTPNEAKNQLTPRDSKISGRYINGKRIMVQGSCLKMMSSPKSKISKLNNESTKTEPNRLTGKISRGKITFVT